MKCGETAFKWVVVVVIGIVSCGDPRGSGQHTEERTISGAPIVVGQLAAAVSAGGHGATAAERWAKGTSNGTPTKGGDVIHAGDRIITAKDGTAMLRLGGGSRVAVNSDTEIRALSPSSIALERGSIWIKDAIGGSQEGIAVTSREGNISLKGGSASLSSSEGELRVAIVSGSASLSGTSGDTTLRGGQEAVVKGGVAQIVPIKDPGGLVSWTAGLRGALSGAVEHADKVQPAASSGLGTLSARVPGSATPLPFEILGQDVSVRIQDRVALTRIEQTFLNPTNRIVEGTYKFPVPAGARLNRYDMEIKGRMMRGEIVERKRGRAIMKTVIRQFIDLMRDPALVEWESGSTFKTRIFPIQAKEKKRIVLSYIQTLEGAGGRYRYVLPVAPAGSEPPKVPLFRIDARISSSGSVPRVTTPLYPAEIKVEGKNSRVGFEKRDFEPLVDFVVQIDQTEHPNATLATFDPSDSTDSGRSAPVRLNEGEDNYFLMNIAPELPAANSDMSAGSDWIFLVDTSQSRGAVDMEIEKRVVASLIGALGSADRVKIISFDLWPRVMDERWAAPSKGLLDRLETFIGSVQPAGATNLAGALDAAARQLDSGSPARVLLIGDGAATLGEKRPGALAEMARRTFAPSGSSVTGVGVGSSVDRLLMKELSRSTGGRYFALSSGEDLVTASVRIVNALRVPSLLDARLDFMGLEVKEILPASLPSLGSGEEVTVSGRYKGSGRLTAKLSGTLAGEPWESEYVFDVGKAKTSNTFVPLLWASHKIDALTLDGSDRAIKQTVALSKRFSLPSRYTSFIVLENEAMYREFAVKRRGERFEWTGLEEVDYEEAETPDMDAFESLAGIGKSGASGRSASGMGARKMSAQRPARPSMKKKASSMPDDLLAEIEHHSRRRPRRRCSNRYEYDFQVWRSRTDTSEKDRNRIAELGARIEKEPLARKHRKNLIKKLMQTGQYDVARQEVDRWREMDGANPTVITYHADLMRLTGDMEGALRTYSGLLDIKPEDTRTMSMLASYFEAKSSWRKAHPFRVTLSVIRPKDKRALARRAVGAARAELWDEAAATAGELVDEDENGTQKLSKGIRLPKSLREAVLRLARREKLPLLFESPSRDAAKHAKFSVELEWEGDADLDLWVGGRRNRYLGGGSSANLVDAKTGGQGEILYMSSAAPGVYKVQVLCAHAEGCGGISGKVKIRGPWTRRTIPFTLQNGAGTDVALMQIERWRVRCGW